MASQQKFSLPMFVLASFCETSAAFLHTCAVMLQMANPVPASMVPAELQGAEGVAPPARSRGKKAVQKEAIGFHAPSTAARV